MSEVRFVLKIPLRRPQMGEVPIGLHRVSDDCRQRLGEECKKLRDMYNMSLTAIAQRKGVSVPSVRNWIRKTESPK